MNYLIGDDVKIGPITFLVGLETAGVSAFLTQNIPAMIGAARKVNYFGNVYVPVDQTVTRLCSFAYQKGEEGNNPALFALHNPENYLHPSEQVELMIGLAKAVNIICQNGVDLRLVIKTNSTLFLETLRALDKCSIEYDLKQADLPLSSQATVLGFTQVKDTFDCLVAQFPLGYAGWDDYFDIKVHVGRVLQSDNGVDHNLVADVFAYGHFEPSLKLKATDHTYLSEVK